MMETLEPRCLLASLSGEVFVDADGDGQKGASEEGAAIRVYLDANDNQTIDATETFVQSDSMGQYSFMNVPAGEHIVRVEASPSRIQTSPTAYFGTGYTSGGDGTGTNPTQLFEMSLGGDVRPIGTPTTDRIHDLVRTNDGAFFGVNFQTDAIYSIDPLTGQETLLSQSTVDLVAGLAYDPRTDTIYTVAGDNGALELRTVDQVSGQLGASTAAAEREVRAINFGSTFYDFNTDTQTAVAVPRQTLSPFASTLDVRSDGAIFGLQGNSLNQYAFPSAGSTATTLSTLSQSIEAISFGANDQLFGVSSSPSTFHQINPATGVVSPGVAITFGGNSISGVTGFDIAPDGTHYLVDSTHLYTFDPITGVAIQAPNRGVPSLTFTSLSVSADGALFATLFNVTTPIAEIDPATGLATPLGDGPLGSPYASIVAQAGVTRLNGLSGVSDLAFDTVRQRIVGFDNDSDQFFQFTTDGFGSILATADRPLDSWSLAFNGTTFVMFDQDDPNFTRTLEVNPDTGEIVDGFLASQRLPTEGLFHAKSGDVAFRVSVVDTDNLTALDFGVSEEINFIPDHPTVINEILLTSDPTTGTVETTDQLIELRGDPGGQLKPNTYLLSVDEFDLGQGEITGVFDLSDQAFGANGFLVLLQQGSPHQVHPDSAVLQSSDVGFTNLLGATFESFTTRGAGYFLIESDVPPVVGADIDLDDDGLADPNGVVADWNVLDSLSLHPFVGSQSYGQAYGQILMTESSSFDPNLRTVAPGTPIVIGNSYGYAARVGDSVGSDPDDWMFGAIKTDNGFQVHDNVAHLPNPFVFLERNLDHFGESNFVGGVRGRVEVFPALGATDGNGNLIPPQPLVGVTVFADTNGNGSRDLITHSVDPDDGIDRNNLFDVTGIEIPQPQTHAFPGVTLSTADRIFGDQPINFEVRSIPETNSIFFPNSNRIFAHLDIGFFLDTRKLRADFYEPVREVSIQAIGTGNSTSIVYGRIEAYNAEGDLLDFSLSGPLTGNNREKITVRSPNDDIAYTLAYSDTTTFPGSSPFGRLDELEYKQLEIGGVTDENGVYEIKNLFPDEYQVVIQQGATGLIGMSPTAVEVTRYENFVVNQSLRINSPPQVEPEFEFTIEENAPSGTMIGFIDAVDLDGQQVSFEILSGSESGILVDESTGAVSVGPEAVLDFEETSLYSLTIGISDSLGTAESTVTVELIDLNEAPIVETSVFFVAEDTPSGTTIGQVEAFDPDFQQNQVLSFEIVGGSSIFAIDPSNGLISLISAIDFEVEQEHELTIRVSDGDLVTEILQIIRVIDQNDRPDISSSDFLIPENSTGVVAQIEVTDPDLNQTHTFELIGGTGTQLFRVSRTGEIIVRDGVKIDYEQGSSYKLQVIAVDSGLPPLADTKELTLKIQDVNEPPALNQATARVAENSLGGTQVGAIFTVVDPEGGMNYSIALLNEADASKFVFNPMTNLLTVVEGADLDFETQRVNTLRFEITDIDEVDPPTQVTLLVELTDENDPPAVVTTSLTMSELARPDTIVGRVEVQDLEPDNGDPVTVRIVGGNAETLFTLDPISRILRVADGAQFDADGNPDPLFIEVEVTDQGGLSSVGRIDIILNDVNEPPVIVVAPPASTTIGSGDDFKYVIPPDAIVDPEGRAFAVSIFDENGQLPGWLKFNAATKTLSGLPTPLLVGSYPLTLRALEPGPLDLYSDVSFTLIVERGQTPLTNQRNRLDVDANGDIAPLDALRVLNYMQRHGVGVSVDEQFPFTGFVDTTGDGIVTSRDALLVINGIQASNNALGEFVSLDDDDDRDQANDQALTELLQEFLLF